MSRLPSAAATAVAALVALHVGFAGGIRMAAPGPMSRDAAGGAAPAAGVDELRDAAEDRHMEDEAELKPSKSTTAEPSKWNWADSDTESEGSSEEEGFSYDPGPMNTFMVEYSRLRNSLLDNKKQEITDHLRAIQEVMLTLSLAPGSYQEYEKACDDLLDLRERFLAIKPKGSVAIYRAWLSSCEGSVWPVTIPRRYHFEMSLDSVSELHLDDEG